MLLLGSIFAGIAILASILYTTFKSPYECDLSVVSNRDFNVYYGILDERNPFGKLSAENNQNAPLFKTIITETMKTPSMIMKGKYGAGKTQIREYRLSEVDKNTIVVKIYGNNPSLNNYFSNFVENSLYTNRNNKQNRNNENEEINKVFVNHFKSVDFMHIILAELTTLVINSMNFENSRQTLIESISFEERFKIVCLLSFYSKMEMQDTLMTLVNDILYDKLDCWLCKSLSRDKLESIGQQVWNPTEKRYEDKPRLTELHELFKSIRIFNEKQKSENAVFLFRFGEFMKNTPSHFLQDTPFEAISILSKFLKTSVNKRLLLVLDSLDENEFFFDQKQVGKPNKEALQAFIDSIVTSEVLSLALGLKDDVIFDIIVFIPAIEGLQIENWHRIDKIPVVDLEWDYLMLYNYADFVLSYLGEQSAPRCKRVPLFSELLNGTEIALRVVKELRNPRDLHIFVNNLIMVMNQNVMLRNEPFIAFGQDVNVALKNAKNQMVYV